MRRDVTQDYTVKIASICNYSVVTQPVIQVHAQGAPSAVKILPFNTGRQLNRNGFVQACTVIRKQTSNVNSSYNSHYAFNPNYSNGNTAFARVICALFFLVLSLKNRGA